MARCRICERTFHDGMCIDCETMLSREHQRALLHGEEESLRKQIADAEREAERQQDVHDLFVRVLDTISGRAFLRNEENRAFQMMGRYDGAMSEACKALFARQKADVEAVQVILQAARAAGGEV
jgi:hypothetical protein